MTGLPSATTTTPGRTASTLQPSVGYSASGTSTSRTPEVRAAARTARRAAAAGTRPRRRRRRARSPTAGGRARPGPASTGRRRSGRRRRRSPASWRAPASLVRSVRPMHSRSGRSQNVSPPSIVPGASIRPSVGMPRAARPRLEDVGLARRGWACRAGAGSRRRRRSAAGRRRRRGPGRPSRRRGRGRRPRGRSRSSTRPSCSRRARVEVDRVQEARRRVVERRRRTPARAP